VAPETFAATFRREIQTLEPDAKIWHGPFVLSKRLEYNHWGSRVNGTLFLIFAGIALLLAALGLYGVIAYSVSRRTQEFGVRIAVGARAGDILRLVLRQGAMPLIAGLATGAAGAFGVNRVLQAQLFNVSPTDPLALGVASTALIVAAGLGCWIPARRASQVDPLTALRHE
jgi:ABC-type antimicrobial peptide transport system permease subunit